MKLFMKRNFFFALLISMFAFQMNVGAATSATLDGRDTTLSQQLTTTQKQIQDLNAHIAWMENALLQISQKQNAEAAKAAEAPAPNNSGEISALQSKLNKFENYFEFIFILSGVSLLFSVYSILPKKVAAKEVETNIVHKEEVTEIMAEAVNPPKLKAVVDPIPVLRPILHQLKEKGELYLINEGTIAAKEIRVWLGGTTKTLKKRLDFPQILMPGEKVLIHLQRSTPNSVISTKELNLYWEYQHPETNKVFKDQCSLIEAAITPQGTPYPMAASV